MDFWAGKGRLLVVGVTLAAALAVFAGVPGRAAPTGAGGAPPAATSTPMRTTIVVAGQPFEVGRPVVLWSDPQGFDGYQTRCIDQSGGCCDADVKRYGARANLPNRTLDGLQNVVSQLVLHFDGCVNSRSCFKSMHNRPRPRGGAGCGLSAHFMIDADGTIYQTLDLVERAYHAEQANSTSVGVEICNRGRVDRSEWAKLPPDYQTRPTRNVVINGEQHEAYDFRPEQYDSIVALARTLLRVFPKIKPVIPQTEDGAPLMETLAEPMQFAGILGHLHVDLQRQKWDPGALDWKRILRALNGFDFPVQIRSFVELPTTQGDLLLARRAAFQNAEERSSGHFPVASGRLWHSGVHLRAAPGTPVRAPTRGHIIAARRAEGGASARSFVLIRHDLVVDGDPITFYSLIAHLSLPAIGSVEASAIPWLQHVTTTSPEGNARLQSGEVAHLDQPVEAGDVVGAVGLVSRGPEQGPEIHFEIFTTARLTGEFGRTFRYINAADDGAIVRRSELVAMMDANADQQLDGDELTRFFRAGELDRRQALRRLAIHHRHEWGDRSSESAFIQIREFAGLDEDERKRLYRIAFAPYLFWDDELSTATGLPQNQTVYSYHPLTFLLELAARTAHIDLPRPRGREVGDTTANPRKLAGVPLSDWTKPKKSTLETPLFGPAVGVRLGVRRREDIPLIELEPTDSR